MQKKVIHDIYYKPITFSNLYKMWKIVKITCKNKKEIFIFSRNINTNLYNLGKILLNGCYEPKKFRLFLVFEPKQRLVMSQDINDKIINHFVANYYLLPYLENKLIDSNVATRKNKGTSYAISLFEKYIHEIRMKYKNKEIYVLKLDISKYFYTINHDILFGMLKKDIDDKNVLNLIRMIIDETNKSYINETISQLNSNYKTDIPFYNKGVGLSIGAMTSQFLAIYYLNNIDHFIKEKLLCKYYIRYMDDFIIIDIDKNNLKKIWNIIEIKLNELKLKINPKSNIYKMSNGVSFLDYKYIIKNNKLEILFNKKTSKRINKKLYILKKNNQIKYYKSYASYYGYFSKIKKMERNFKMKSIDKYINLKKEYSKKIVFIREGKFYITFQNDAMIIWNIFNYKWYNDCISFGDRASFRVFDILKKNGLGYVVSSNENVIVMGDNRIYDLQLELSNINYDKYLKRKKINELIDNILFEDMENYNNIIEYLVNIKK